MEELERLVVNLWWEVVVRRGKQLWRMYLAQHRVEHETMGSSCPLNVFVYDDASCRGGRSLDRSWRK